MPTSLVLASAVAVGIGAGVFLDSYVLAPARWLVALLGLTSFLLAARGAKRFATWPAYGALAAACVIWGAFAQAQAMRPPLRMLLNERLGGFDIDAIDTARHDTPYVVEGRLTGDATLEADGASLRMVVDRIWLSDCAESASGGVSLTIVGALAAEHVSEWRSGRRIRAPAVLRRPARYLDAGVPDQERLLARRGIALVGSVKSGALVQVIGNGNWFDEAAAALRAAVRASIGRYVGSRDPQSAAIAIAILIGDRGSLDPDMEQRLREAGTYHVIAISGGNIAIVAGLVLGGLWIIGIRDGWAAAAAIALLSAYAFVAGGGASVMRATVMAGIYLALRIIDQRTAAVHAMALTAVVILIATPLAIADVGLWLTFGATAAIIAGARVVRMPSRAWLRAPVALALASLSAEILLIPIGALIFERITLAGLGANLVAVPCMGVAQIAAMVTTAADWMHLVFVARIAGWITHIGVRGLVGSSAIVDWAPWLTWRVPSPALALIVCYYAAVLCWCSARLSSVRTGAAIVASVLMIWIATAPPTLARRFGDGRLHLSAIDVGQGDSLLVTFPNGRTMIVDTGGVSAGGGFDIGDRVVGPVLRYRGIGHLDYLAVTHGDLDHIGGAASLARDFRPAEIWYGTFVNHHMPTMQLQAIAAATGSAWRWLLANDRVEIGDVEIRVHNPPLADWQRQKVRNSDSLVIELRYGQVSMLLMGDAGEDVERMLIPTLDLLPIVVLKSPHHGSATSSSQEFIDAIKPTLVVISCGRGNSFGHPVTAVVERYKSAGAQVLRTDQVGQIDIVTDGTSLTATTYTGIQMQPRRH
jgi:competence protein ComEC